MKIRIKFSKYGVMKFVGHLDLMRYFQKAFRRADIDICYSEGFSPHQIMSFAAPLGVGLTSDGEYLDIEVHTTMTSEDAISRINETMVDGIEVTGYVRLPDNAKTAMSIVSAADYLIYYKEGMASLFSVAEWEEMVREHFDGQETFLLTKKTKKGEKTIDLKQLVYEFRVEKCGGQPAFFLRVATGSIENLKPEMVVEALFERCGAEYCESAMQIHRMEIYATESDGGFIALGDMGEVIF